MSLLEHVRLTSLRTANPDSSAFSCFRRPLKKRHCARPLLKFKTAAQAMPKDAEPYYQAGLAALGLADTRNAVAYFNKALQLNPKHPGAGLKLAGLMAT